jgi:hypothetical protein
MDHPDLQSSLFASLTAVNSAAVTERAGKSLEHIFHIDVSVFVSCIEMEEKYLFRSVDSFYFTFIFLPFGRNYWCRKHQ